MIEWFNDISDGVGMVGVAFLIVAYFLLSTNRMSSQSLKYQLLNLCGAVLILFSLCFHFNLSSFVIELVWIVISLIGIYRIMSYRKQQAPVSPNVYKLSERKKKRQRATD